MEDDTVSTKDVCSIGHYLSVPRCFEGIDGRGDELRVVRCRVGGRERIEVSNSGGSAPVAAAYAEADCCVERIVVVRQFIPRRCSRGVVPRLLEETVSIDRVFRTGSETQGSVRQDARRRYAACGANCIIGVNGDYWRSEAERPSGQKGEDAF